MRSSKANDSGQSSLSDTVLWVVCLCAEWCHICRVLRPRIAAVETRSTSAMQLIWVDVEDHADLLGDLEVETFPTYLIGRNNEVLLYAPGPTRLDALTEFIAPYAAGRMGAQRASEQVNEALKAIVLHLSTSGQKIS
jgi:thioredoxin 1